MEKEIKPNQQCDETKPKHGMERGTEKKICCAESGTITLSQRRVTYSFFLPLTACLPFSHSLLNL